MTIDIDTIQMPEPIIGARGIWQDYRIGKEQVHQFPDVVNWLTNEMLKNIAEEEEKYLLDVFGSREFVEKYGRLYVLESNIVSKTTDEDSIDCFRYRIEEEIRLRPKTFEELDRDGIMWPLHAQLQMIVDVYGLGSMYPRE